MKKRRILFVISFILAFVVIVINMPAKASVELVFPGKIVVDGYEYTPEVKDGVYTFLLPRGADTSKLKLCWSDTLWQVNLGESTIKSGDFINVSKGECVLNLIYDGIASDAKCVVMKGSESISTLYLDMSKENRDFVHESKGNKTKITANIINNAEDDNKILSAPAEVKGVEM